MKLLFTVPLLFSFIIAEIAIAKDFSNGCKITAGPTLNGVKTYAITAKKSMMSDEMYTLYWAKYAEGDGKPLFKNSRKFHRGDTIIPVYTNGELDQALTSEAVYACTKKGLRLPTNKDFDSFESCFAKLNDSGETLSKLFPDMGGHGGTFWSSTKTAFNSAFVFNVDLGDLYNDNSNPETTQNKVICVKDI